MPPLAPPGPVIRCSFQTTDGASHVAGSRFFLKYSGGTPTSADLNTLASDISTAWGAHVAGVVLNSEHLTQVVCTDLSSDTGNEGTWDGSVAGTLGGSSLPANIAACVNHSIARRYRGGRPRTFLRCGTQGTMATPNEWTNDFQGEVQSAWEGWIAAILALSGFGFTLLDDVNVSWYSGNTVFTTPTGRARNIPVARVTPIVDNITASTVAIKLGSQRRRLDV
jgi:hypothetical protein